MVAGRNELLQGPSYYAVILIAVTLLFWRNSLVGFATISVMCGGDGLADIIGRRLGTAKLPWNKDKSWAGSLAMFGGTLLRVAVALHQHAPGPSYSPRVWNACYKIVPHAVIQHSRHLYSFLAVTFVPLNANIFQVPSEG